MERVYLDSCIVIYLVQASAEIRSILLEALRPKDRSAPRVCLSPLTRLECRVGPMQKADDRLLAEFDRFFALRDLQVLPLDEAVFELATELRAAHRLKTPDALHLAAAIHGGCDAFWTNDQRIPGAVAARIAIRVLP